VLRIVRPVAPNPAVPPRTAAGPARCHMLAPAEGELLMRWRGAADAPRPFVLSPRTHMHRALALLVPDGERGALDEEDGVD
jgi:hypothetical protein